MSAPDLDLRILRSIDDLAAYPAHPDRIAYEEAVGEAGRGQETWRLAGYCQACDAAAVLAGDWRYSNGSVPNFRECLFCPRCGLNNRQRFVAKLVQDLAPRVSYVYEQVTPFYAWAAQRLPSVVGSEYLGLDIASGTEIDGLRHEDALALSFPDASLELIVSNDVFEHVPDIDAALREAARVLEPGGRMIFSIPFYGGREQTVRRAALRDGRVVNLLPPEYHGNPVDSEGGSLVFYEHGWEILDRCRAAGFADAYAVAYWSALYGYIGDGMQLVFVAEGP